VFSNNDLPRVAPIDQFVPSRVAFGHLQPSIVQLNDDEYDDKPSDVDCHLSFPFMLHHRRVSGMPTRGFAVSPAG